jgi:hypothetical protein
MGDAGLVRKLEVCGCGSKHDKVAAEGIRLMNWGRNMRTRNLAGTSLALVRTVAWSGSVR